MTVTVTGTRQITGQEVCVQADLQLGKVLLIALRVVCVAVAVLTLVTAIIAEAPALLHYTCMFAVASCVLFTFDSTPDPAKKIAQFTKPLIRANTPHHTRNTSKTRLLTPSPSLSRQKSSPPLSPVLTGEPIAPRSTPARLITVPSFTSWPTLLKKRSSPFLSVSTSYSSLNNRNFLARVPTASQAGGIPRA